LRRRQKERTWQGCREARAEDIARDLYLTFGEIGL
jgi:hypothetical protein